ncbi:hypothetical protein IU414_06695 [Nocardia farcinica]|uniref:hypothetical protein n=1 Tax=Nocardia farcinica TaxID=37329 RepID=UPI001892DE40|nr:hypothetical protein [Nocardia farcinica]MBF6254385.1 hypothetical protein [Nocardia farcinica]MBF6584447.1 hypothetical protein [Nocardia farcinica]
MRAVALISTFVLAAAVAGCSSDASEPVAVTTTTEPASSDDLGKAWEFTGDGAKYATVRFTDAQQLPSQCLLDPPATGTLIGVRAEVENHKGQPIELGADLLQVNDANGFTQETQLMLLHPNCRGQYPELADAPAPGKAAGWVFLQSPVESPSALVYTPMVWAEGAGVDNFDFIALTPDHVVVRLPALPTAPTQPTTTTVAEPEPEPTPAPTQPAPTQAPASTAPTSGQACDIDTDTWAKDANGQQLRCAYAGGPTPRWVNSRPFIGIREPGTPCELGEAVAESPAGVPMVCVGTSGDGEWQPGP